MVRRGRLVPGLASTLSLVAAVEAAERILYEKESVYNTVVVTEDDRGLRTLRFERDGLRQSVVKVGDPDHIELAYPKAMLAALAFVEKPKRMLVVGLGGATLPGILHKHYPRTMIDAVDIDPDVVAVAKEFFGFREDATMRAHVGDGRRFIETCREPYDLIFLDAFGAEDIPDHLVTQQFLEAVRRALSPAGVAAAHIWDRGSNPLYDSMVRTYQEVFDELYIVNVRGAGSRILIALPRRQRIERESLVQRAGEISREKGLRFDLADLVRDGLRRADKINSRGSILRDRTTTATASSPATR